MCFYKRNEMKPGEIGMDEKRLLIVLVHVYKNAKNVLNIIIISIILPLSGIWKETVDSLGLRGSLHICARN
jgi:hypothetical protein